MQDPLQLPSKVEAKHSGRVVDNVNLLTIETGDNLDQDFNAPASVFDSKAHYLHGVVHANGYGHLLRMNGRDGGNERLNGRQLMSIWDAICRLLGAREVSVEDVSNKSGMLLRVLHASAFRLTW